MGGGGGEGTKVHLGDLKEHQNQVSEILGELRTAVDAGGQAGALFDINAFGIVGQVFAAPIQIWVSSARSALDQVVSTGEEISNKLNDTHQSYSDNEQGCKVLFTNLDKGAK